MHKTFYTKIMVQGNNKFFSVVDYTPYCMFADIPKLGKLLLVSSWKPEN